MNTGRAVAFRTRWGLASWLCALAGPAWILLVAWRQGADPRHVHPLTEGLYRVAGVIDGFHLRVMDPARQDEVVIRLLGVGGRTPMGMANTIAPVEFTRSFVDAQTVRLRFDRRRIDDDGTPLAYVFVADRCLNEELLRNGWATCTLEPFDSSSMRRRFLRAEKDASAPVPTAVENPVESAVQDIARPHPSGTRLVQRVDNIPRESSTSTTLRTEYEYE